jgi:putative transposase
MVEYMQYRWANVAGGTHFFTVNLAERKRSLLVDYVDLLRAVIEKARRRTSFKFIP